MDKPLSSLRNVIYLFAIVMGTGTLGYYYIEDYTMLEAFYMVVQTVSTVGFNEIKPLSTAGVWFTILLISGSFGTFAYGATMLAQLAMDGSVRQIIKARRVKKKIEKMSGHIIVCGMGRNGRQALKKLMAYGTDVVVIERSKDIIERYQELLANVHVLEGDATEDQVLIDAGIASAQSLVAALQSDTDNLFVVISSRQLNPKLTIGSRANSESTEKKLLAAGADYTVSPNLVGGAHLAHNLMNPGGVDFLDHLSVGGSSATNIEELSLDHLPQSFSTCTIKELEIRQQTGCTVIGYVGQEGNLEINPSPDFIVGPHAKLYVLGNDAQIQSLRNWFDQKALQQ